MGALAAVHAHRALLTVAAAKASVGHAEASSGQVGLSKLHQLLGCGFAAGNAQLRSLNTLVGERLGLSTHIALPTQAISCSLVVVHETDVARERA